MQGVTEILRQRGALDERPRSSFPMRRGVPESAKTQEGTKKLRSESNSNEDMESMAKNIKLKLKQINEDVVKGNKDLEQEIEELRNKNTQHIEKQKKDGDLWKKHAETKEFSNPCTSGKTWI